MAFARIHATTVTLKRRLQTVQNTQTIQTIQTMQTALISQVSFHFETDMAKVSY